MDLFFFIMIGIATLISAILGVSFLWDYIKPSAKINNFITKIITVWTYTCSSMVLGLFVGSVIHL